MIGFRDEGKGVVILLSFLLGSVFGACLRELRDFIEDSTVLDTKITIEIVGNDKPDRLTKWLLNK